MRKVIFCSGKVYYELLEKRREQKQNDIAIIRLEQLYPFPEHELKQALEPYAHVKTVVWCQEEPKNQGAWYIMYDRFLTCLPKSANLVMRDANQWPRLPAVIQRCTKSNKLH